MATLLRIILLIFFIDMGFYLFSDAMGISKNMLLIEEDLFHKVVNTENLATRSEFGNVTENFNPEPQSGEGSLTLGGISIFDSLGDAWRFVKEALFSVLNIVAMPFIMMGALTQPSIGMPKPIAIFLFSPFIIILGITIISFIRGKD